MAEKRRFFDVWIIETNQVYKEVPYTVVADWVQQGRLLEDDMLKPSGTAEWFRLGGMPAFAAYLPKADQYRAEDQAEALEPVEGGFRWKPATDEEEEEVDMIPLIDVSLVLLVFFIMTTTGAFFINIMMPKSAYTTVTSNPDLLWIGIDYKDENTLYSLGMGDQPPAKEDSDLQAREQLLRRLDERLTQLEQENKLPVQVQIKADEKLPAGEVVRMRVELGKRIDKIAKVWAGVREKGFQ